MTALVLTCLVSFVLGGLLAQTNWKAFNYFNAQTLGGAVLATLTVIAAIAVSLLATAITSGLLGIDRVNWTVVVSFIAGFSLVHIWHRTRDRR